MRIGELSAITGASVRSLRYYEEQGLVNAERSVSGQRHFADDAVERVALIQRLFAAGLCSSTMVELLPCISDPSAGTPLLAARLRAERERITQSIASLSGTRDALDQVIAEADTPSASVR
ncbi:MAG: MerR family transcriptional regulator [Lacisediminihabitans sp.]